MRELRLIAFHQHVVFVMLCQIALAVCNVTVSFLIAQLLRLLTIKFHCTDLTEGLGCSADLAVYGRLLSLCYRRFILFLARVGVSFKEQFSGA